MVAKLIKVRDSSMMTALEVRMHDTSLFISYLKFGKLTYKFSELSGYCWWKVV